VIYFCCDERRRQAVKQQARLNGMDFLEVVDNPADPVELRQCTLLVYFIHPIAPDSLTAENVRIEGGERIRPIIVTGVETGGLESPPSSPPAMLPTNLLIVRVKAAGDFSTYTLRLVQDPEHPDPPPGFDPVLSAIDFSFKVACPSDFDCQQPRFCPTEPGRQPEINYLAKDYASFRQLMLDRMAVLMPQWQERNPADLGIALVELLAYVGDYLSYQQDAVATEAYVGTARRRVSMRRHARLVDYFMHEGCNARVWVQVRVRDDVDNLLLQRSTGTHITKLLTRVSGQARLMSPQARAYQSVLAARPEVFELLHDITLSGAHNELHFYTWGARECCLPKGATRATLRGSFPHLNPGDVLILAEVRGPQTGEPEDADPTHRHAVRLKRVTLATDPLGGQFVEEPHDDPLPVTEIEWNQADALPFALCISARRGTAYYDDVSVALGNVVLADHGLTIRNEPLDTVPDSNPALTKVRASNGGRCEEHPVTLTPPRFRPRLAQAPLTYAAPYDVHKPPASAAAAMRWATDMLLPATILREPGVSEEWRPKRDLLNSGPSAKEFVVETETDGAAYLRFGDDRFGSRPASGTTLEAIYRVGNGVRGNIGAEALWHIVSDDPAIITDLDDPVIIEVRNPMPAQGGIEPESIEQVRQNAPSAFRTQERAVTTSDYANVAQRCELDVQRAAATLRWTGSWRTVFLTVDRLGGVEVDNTFENNLRRCLERYRMAGHDVEVDSPRHISLAVEMVVCVKPFYFTSDVKAAVLEVFSNRVLPDGRRGVFHPDNFTFGQTVYLSPLYAAAHALAGVDSVEITKFQRQGIDNDDALKAGKLVLSRLEIARLDNDPNFPEHGIFNVILKGGR
jgi:hypothetical protein